MTMTRFMSLEKKLREEAGDIVTKAAGWFFHCLSGNDTYEGNKVVYQCFGREMDGRWSILVRLATYKPYSSTPKEDSNVEDEEKSVCSFPEAIENPDNELFASFSDLVVDDPAMP